MIATDYAEHVCTKSSSSMLQCALIGALAGYLILHPITMAICHLQECWSNPLGITGYGSVVKQMLMSFSVSMLPMALLFSLMGSLMGTLYGYHAAIILGKNNLLAQHERDLEEQVILLEKQASLGVMASCIGHEINNALMVLLGSSQTLEAHRTCPHKYAEDLKNVALASSTLQRLSSALLDLGRPRASEPRPVDLCELVDDVTEVSIMCGVLKRIHIQKHYPARHPYVVCDPFQMEQVIRNIGINASHAMEGQGSLQIEIGVHPESNVAYIRISDDGPGIPSEDLAHIFEPFFTTKDDSAGTGLGLSIVKRVVEHYGGNVSATNQEHGGTQFEIVLPLAEPGTSGEHNA